MNSNSKRKGTSSPTKSVFWKEKKTELANIKDTDKDDIAALLDNVPELDSIFTVIRRIGRGTFSSVYLGYSKKNILDSHNKNYFAIKHIIPTSHPSRVYMELKCLKLLGGKDNIIKPIFCCRNLNHIVLVMPFIPHDSFVDYVGNLTTEELCDYILNLLKALEKVHSYNIIHRDIKPANFLYYRKHRRYALIDFGLAQDVGKEPHLSGSANHNEKKKSCQITDTPHLNISKTVKRKLADNGMNNHLNTKKPRLIHQYSNLGKAPLLKSPIKKQENRDVTTPTKSPNKNKNSQKVETNATTPTRKDKMYIDLLNDSPSKNTRSAEAARLMAVSSSFKDGDYCGIQNSTGKGILQPGNNEGLRRSPRKSFRNNMQFSKCHSNVSTSNSGFSLNESFTTKNQTQTSTLREVKTRSGQSVLCPTSCICYGTPKVCPVCLGRKNQHASRAGTPGFRAPEVLLRHPKQTTAVDIWSMGVILLCLASSHYPFFRASDDLSSLAEITTIFGSKIIKKIAANLDKLLTISEEKPPLDLRKVCEILRENLRLKSKEKEKGGNINKGKEIDYCKGCKQVSIDCVCLTLIDNPKNSTKIIPSTKSFLDSLENSLQSGTSERKSSDSVHNLVNDDDEKDLFKYPAVFYDLLYKILDPNPSTRITAKNALSHPFISQYSKKNVT